jgi:hypothetical protein
LLSGELRVVKPLHALLAFGSVVAAAIAGACSSSSNVEQGVDPDAMLPTPDDVATSPDATDGGEDLSTWVRVAHLVPQLGPISVCVLAPGSDTWRPLIGPAAAEDGGAPGAEAATEASSDAATDGASSDRAAVDAPMRDRATDAPHDASLDASRMRDGGAGDGPTEGPPREGGLRDRGGPSDADDGRATDGALSDAEMSDVEAGAGGVALAPLTMSHYTKVEGAGTFQLAILPANATSCTEAYFSDYVTLDSSNHSTVVLSQTSPGMLATPTSYLDWAGEAPLPFGLQTYTDERGVTAGSARTRFINVTTPGAGDAGNGPLSAAILDSTANVVPLASVIEPGRATEPSETPPFVDALGYSDALAMSGRLALRIGPAGDGGSLPWTSAVADLGLGRGSLHTAFILSAAVEEYQVLWCNDETPEGFLTNCAVVGQ